MVDGIAEVRLNRPDKLNALDSEAFEAIAGIGERLKTDPSVRVVVLSGAGRAFCAGLDFAHLQAMESGGAKVSGDVKRGNEVIGDTGGRITHLGQQAAHVWSEVPCPVIAAVQGHAVGGGFQLALGADLRVVAPDAVMAVSELRLGLSPDMCGTWNLPRLVGIERTMEIIWTGRIISGSEAFDLGIASRLADDPREAALGLASEIARKSPQSLRGVKALLNQWGTLPIAEHYLAERKLIGSLQGTPNQVEAMTAFFEGRPASFADAPL
jgi:enoyl-CoA hydratase/carnithine racemase